MKNKSIPYGKQYISEKDIQAVVKTLKSDFLTQGPKIAEFEKAFATYIGAKYAVAVSNGTAALHLCAMVLNVQPGQKVITVPITFAASANCVKYCGGDVVFADIDPDTFLISIDEAKKLLFSSPKGTYAGIIPVDLAGRAVNLELLKDLSDEYGLWIIEDACHAPGGFFVDSNGYKQSCGNGKFADMAIFSFHPVKHITCGEGGMITTNNEELYKKALLMRTHGITKDLSCLHENQGGWYYEMQALGYNYRLTDFQSSLGISQLLRADEGLLRRREIAGNYYEAFKDRSYIIRQSGIIEGHAYHLYIIQVKNRKGLYDHLREKNIFCQVHYIPVHIMPYYQMKNSTPVKMPASEDYYEHCLSLPMFPTLTNEEQSYVISCIEEFFLQESGNNFNPFPMYGS